VIDKRETLEALGNEMAALEAEIGRQRLIRERATYLLEQAVRELDRLRRHLASLARQEGAA
jgi:hypothetical protein